MLAPVYRPPAPAAFVVPDVAAAAPSTLVTSDPVTLAGPSGVSDVWPVTVDGSSGNPQVRINGGIWTDTRVPAAVARAGDVLEVRVTAGPANAVRDVTVRVGGRSATWEVTSTATTPYTPALDFSDPRNSMYSGSVA